MTESDRKNQLDGLETELTIPEGTSFHLVPEIGEIETTGMNTGRLKLSLLTAAD